MKWLVAVDPKREIVENKKKMLHFIYDEIRRLGPGKVAPNDVWHGLSAAVHEGRLPTKSEPWAEAQRYHIPWLKEHGYVTTDVPYRPRPKQRTWPTYQPQAYEFVSRTSCSPDVAVLISNLRGIAASIFADHEGRLVHEGALFLELSKRPSPKGTRTMWQYFNSSVQPKLMMIGAIRCIFPEDPIMEMALRLMFDQARAKEEA